MLDNFDPPGLKAAAEQVKARFPHVTIEASGVRFFGVCVTSVPRGLKSHLSPNLTYLTQPDPTNRPHPTPL